MFTTKTLFRSSRLSPKLSAAHIVESLVRVHAPVSVIALYLPLVKDPEQRLRLATKANAHDVAINVSDPICCLGPLFVCLLAASCSSSTRLVLFFRPPPPAPSLCHSLLAHFNRRLIDSC